MPQAADVWVGYWPKELFHNSFEFATNVQIGGKVFSPSLEPAKTPMGSGHFVPGDSLKTASADFRLVDTSFGFTSEPKMAVVTDMPDSYQAQYLNGTNVIFGGPDIQKSTSNNCQHKIGNIIFVLLISIFYNSILTQI